MGGNGGCGGQTILDCLMHKLPSSRKYYRVTLIVPDNGIPFIEYHQTNASKKPKKSIPFVDLLFADKKHDTNDEKFAFSIYTTDKTITFLAQDETSMNEWLNKIRECHSNLYPEFKRYDAVFEATLLDRGLAKTMNIQGPYRVALCKESLDLLPLLSITATTITPHSATYYGPHTQHRYLKRHPLLSSKTIELVVRSIRRCGHTDCNFYIESGRHSQIGEGDLWMTLGKKSIARQLHELLLATMKFAPTIEDPYKPRSRSGSENAHRPLQAARLTNHIFSISIFNNNNNSSSNNNNNTSHSIDDDGYLPMA